MIEIQKLQTQKISIPQLQTSYKYQQCNQQEELGDIKQSESEEQKKILLDHSSTDLNLKVNKQWGNIPQPQSNSFPLQLFNYLSSCQLGSCPIKPIHKLFLVFFLFLSFFPKQIGTFEITNLSQISSEYEKMQDSYYIRINNTYFWSVKKQIQDYIKYLRKNNKVLDKITQNNTFIYNTIHDNQTEDKIKVKMAESYMKLQQWMYKTANMSQFNKTFNYITKNIPKTFQYNLKYHQFIYPYNVYKLQNQSQFSLHEGIIHMRKNFQKFRQSYQDLLNIPQQYKSINTTNAINNDTDQMKKLAKKPPQNHFMPDAYLFKKIKNCVNELACQYLSLIPDQIIIKSDLRDQKLNLYKISQTDFVMESRILPLENVSISDQIFQLKKVFIWHFNININNFIFAAKNPKQVIVSKLQFKEIKDQLFFGTIIMSMPLNNTMWDVVNNGSAFRFVKLQKKTFEEWRKNKLNELKLRKKYMQKQQIINSQNEEKEFSKKKMIIPKILQQKVSMMSNLLTRQNLTISNQSKILQIDPNKQSQLNYTQYVNELTIYQIGINQNLQHKSYTTKYYTRQYIQQPVQPHTSIHTQLQQQQNYHHTNYKQMLSVDKYGNFYLILSNKVNNIQNLLKIHKINLNQIQYSQQISIYNIYHNMSNSHINILTHKYKSHLIYYQQPINKQKNQIEHKIMIKSIENKYNNKLKSINLNSNQKQDKQKEYLQHKCKIISQPYPTISANKISVHSVNKLFDQFFSICSKFDNSTQLICTIEHISCTQIYRFTIPLLYYNSSQYKFKWSVKQNILYQYDISIKLILQQIQNNANNFTNIQQQQQIQQVDDQDYLNKNKKSSKKYPYIHIFINRQKLYQYLFKKYEQYKQHQENQWLFENQNTIYYQIEQNNMTGLSQILYGKDMQSDDFIPSCAQLGGSNESDLDAPQSNFNQSDNISAILYPCVSMNNIAQNSSLNLPDLSKIQSFQTSLFFPPQYFQIKQKYRFYYGIKLLQSKLKKILNPQKWSETQQQQIDNCELLWKKQSNSNEINSTEGSSIKQKENQKKQQLIGIAFGNSRKNIKNIENTIMQNKSSSSQPTAANLNNWKICKIVVSFPHKNLFIQPELSSTLIHDPNLTTPTIHHPYKIYRCSLQKVSPLYSKCIYHQWQATAQSKFFILQNYMSIFFIVNEGQTYNLQIKDINTVQMNEIAQSFFIMFISLAIIIVAFTFFIVCKPICIIGCLYFGWISTQPTFKYPLNYFELKLKMRRIIIQKLCKEIRHKNTSKSHRSTQDSLGVDIEQDDEQDDCIFCLQRKQLGEKMIEIYCKHTYHKQCFQQWIRQQNNTLSCPMCKRKLTVDGRTRYMSQLQRNNIMKIGQGQAEIIL